MATTSISSSVAAPKRRASGLVIASNALKNARLPLAAGTFYAFFIAFIIGILYPTMSQLNLNVYLSSSAIAGLLGAKLTTLSTFPALMAIELYSALYVLVWGGIVAYIAGAALPTTIEDGTLDLALARPVSRTRYFLEMWLSAVLGGIILSISTAVAIAFSTLFVKDSGIDWGWLIVAQALELAFMFLASGIGALFGGLLNSSRAAGGAALGILVLFYLMNVLGGISDRLSWMLKVEPLHYVESVSALAAHQITGWYPLVSIVGGLVCGIAGLLIFRRRDLPTT